jgi:AraC-like DNA-binding protein
MFADLISRKKWLFFCKILHFWPLFMDKLFSKKLNNSLRDIENYTRHGAIFYDFSGGMRPIIGGAVCRLCSACVENNKTGEYCFQNAKSFSHQAWIRGSAYSFKCWLGLFGIIIPVAPIGEKIIGAVEIGGLMPEGVFQKNLHQIISTLNSLDPKKNLSSLVSAFQGTKETQPADFAAYGEFLRESLFSSGLLNAKKMDFNAEIWTQQQRISDNKENLKSLSLEKDRLICFLSLELAKACKNANKKQILKKSDEFLSAASLQSEGDIEIFKGFLLVALSIIRMVRIQRESQLPQISSLFVELDALFSGDKQDVLCLNFQNMLLDNFARKPGHSGKSELSEKILSYLSSHFQYKVKLDEVAVSVGASVSSVMHKIKKDTGKTFADLLNEERIKEAKRLLVYTDLSIGEISEKCGFTDQGYFSKVFTKYISMTPRDFRSMLLKGSLLPR